MANFKISLLTPNWSDGNTSSIRYIETPMSEFYSQVKREEKEPGVFSGSRDLTYCYTFNEKVSFSTNSQKTLSFSMTRKILQGDDWITNPFVSGVHVGSLILLTDKYDAQHIFIVSSIKHTLDAINITYDYSCEDFFNYQLSRQNEGYTLTNDSTSQDFIGAKTLDY